MPVNPSMLRETFTVRYLQAGSNPLVLQELLGRADLATVKRYQHLSKQVREKQTRKKSSEDLLPI